MSPWLILLLMAIAAAATALICGYQWIRIAGGAANTDEGVIAFAHSHASSRVLETCSSMSGEDRSSVARTLLQLESRRWKWMSLLAASFAVISLLGLLWPGPEFRKLARPILVTAKDGRSKSLPMKPDLVLSEALTTAGEAAVAETNEDEEPLLVAVKRIVDGDSHIYYYPATLVWGSAPSNLVLKAGDTISLQTLDQTSLGVLDISEPGVAFDVKGMIDRPGGYKTVEPDEVIMNVHTEPYAQSFDTSDAGPDVIVVHRETGETSPHEHYCVPLTNPFVDLILLDSRIRKGDVYEYTRVEQLPELQK